MSSDSSIKAELNYRRPGVTLNSFAGFGPGAGGDAAGDEMRKKIWSEIPLRYRMKMVAYGLARKIGFSGAPDPRMVLPEEERRALMKRVFLEEHEELVTNARPLAEQNQLSLTGNGFLLAKHDSSVADWYDEQHVKRTYYPEVEKLVKSLLPEAIEVCTMSHLARNETGQPGRLGPHHIVHNDFTEEYRDRIAQGLEMVERGEMPKENAQYFESMTAHSISPAMLFSHRVLVLNLWRSTGARPLERNPLALCDSRTIKREDLMEIALPGYNGQTLNPPLQVFTARHNPEQKWYYFPNLTREEVMVFRTFDSHPDGEDGNGTFIPTLHSAISVPGQDEKDMRESCEARVLCLLPLPPGQGAALSKL